MRLRRHISERMKCVYQMKKDWWIIWWNIHFKNELFFVKATELVWIYRTHYGTTLKWSLNIHMWHDVHTHVTWCTYTIHSNTTHFGWRGSHIYIYRTMIFSCYCQCNVCLVPYVCRYGDGVGLLWHGVHTERQWRWHCCLLFPSSQQT